MKLEDQLATLLGPKGWLSSDQARAAHARDWLNKFGVPPRGIVRPASTAETAEFMRLCNEAGVPVIPQGGATGLVGASVACQEDAILLSMSRLNTIESIGTDDFTALVGAGVVLQQLHDALAEHDLEFPLHLGAEGSAQIGGLIATNAGGSHAFRFGTMQDLVFGLEVVLPNGDVWDGTRRLLKDNGGFQLRKLFCGSEGRLGVITRAVLRLYPARHNRATGLIALPDLDAVLRVGRELRSTAGEFLTALEFFDDGILGLALGNVPDLKWPMTGRAPYYLLVELSSSLDVLDMPEILEGSLASSMEADLVADAVLAQSVAQREAIWRIREELPEGSRREGQQLKHDISVPLTGFAAFLDDCAQRVAAILPGARIWTFGHLGDGNIHYNISPPKGETDFARRDADINRAIYEAAEEHGGSFAAEHGVGRSKIGIAQTLRSPTERALMARIHRAMDPKDIMNPGVVV